MKRSMRRRSNQVAPSMQTGQAKMLTAEELETAFNLSTPNSLLKVSALPLPSSEELIRLTNLKSFKDSFMATAEECLTKLEETLKEMFDKSSVSVLPFLPAKIESKSKSKNKTPSMTEIESLFFVILESIRLVDEPNAKLQADFVRNCVSSLTGLLRWLQVLETHVTTHRKELKNHSMRLRNLYTQCKSDYENAVQHAAELFTDFYINIGADTPSNLSMFPNSSTGIPDLRIPPSHKLRFRCQPNGYAVYTRFPETTPNWKDGITFNAQIRDTMLKGISAEFESRVRFAISTVKSSLSQIFRPYKASADEPATSLRLEIDKLGYLLRFRRLDLPPEVKTTLIFLFMRVEQSMENLNTLLYNLAQSLMALRARVKYLSKNCASWRLLQKKIIYGPMSYIGEMQNYLKLEIPLTTTSWTDPCVADFIFEMESAPVVEPTLQNVLSLDDIEHFGKGKTGSEEVNIFGILSAMDKTGRATTLQPEKVQVLFGGGDLNMRDEDLGNTDSEAEELKTSLDRMKMGLTPET